ncbi:MAG: hypothetical protein QG570_87 [Patescibacteria group bacterium]|nr:hypothetical protein [Patescibacteria group bacterium]
MDGFDVMYPQSELFSLSGDIIDPTQVQEFLVTLNGVNELYDLVTEGRTTGPRSVEKFGEEWKIGSSYSDVVHRRLGYISGSTKDPYNPSSTYTIHQDEPIHNGEGRLISSTTEIYRIVGMQREASLLTFESRPCSTSIARFNPEKWLSRVEFSRFVRDPNSEDVRSDFRLFLDESMTRIGR